MDASLAQELTARAEELGLEFEDPEVFTKLSTHDSIITTLIRGNSRAKFRVVHSPTLTASAANLHEISEGRVPLLVVGPRVTERSAAMLRTMSINYLDQAGNAYIDFPGVHIDVRGRKPTAPPPPNHASRGGINLFSKKRAQVIFAILEWPELLDNRLRDLADSAGTSLGQTQNTLDLLKDLGYLTSTRRFIPQKRKDLVDQWVDAYQTGLEASWDWDTFTADTIDFEDCGHVVFLSGESAASHLVRAETTVVYASDLPTNMIRRYRWRRDHEQPNIYLRKKFWKTPGGSETPGIYKAPKLLIYADLLASRNSRQREAATRLRKELS